MSDNMDQPFDDSDITFDKMDNTRLMANARTLHGALYKRINTLQRDLNILREAYNLSRMQLPTPDNSIPAPIMHALRFGGMPERFNTIESITEWIKLIVHL